MTTTLITHMQAAVEAIASSPHPTSKVAAAIAGTAPDGALFLITKTNYWPPAIEAAFGRNTKIGNSSGTIHAETACILAAPQTEGADIFITDPPCPNCMKNIAEAGIKNIYIDHKGFNKDFARRRGHHFENMSMRICEKAGINLFEINRKEGTATPILEIEDTYTPPNEYPALIKKEDNTNIYDQRISQYKTHFRDEPFALCLAKNTQGEVFSIATIGYTAATMENKRGESGGTPVREDKTRGESVGTTEREDKTRGESVGTAEREDKRGEAACKAERDNLKSEKYSFILQPVNRLLMNTARHGLTIQPNTLYTSRTPTSREFINMIGMGLNAINIGNPEQSRDEFGIMALEQLRKAKIL